jgi:hypothetical protein
VLTSLLQRNDCVRRGTVLLQEGAPIAARICLGLPERLKTELLFSTEKILQMQRSRRSTNRALRTCTLFRPRVFDQQLKASLATTFALLPAVLIQNADAENYPTFTNRLTAAHGDTTRKNFLKRNPNKTRILLGSAPTIVYRVDPAEQFLLQNFGRPFGRSET